MPSRDQEDWEPQRMAQETTDPASLSGPAVAPRASAELVVVHAPKAADVGRRATLGVEITTVGRDVEAPGLCIDDRRMSRLHARFTYDARAGMYRVGDAKSKNHSYVNGEPIDTQLLSDGDVIRAGDTLLVYSEGSAIGAARARADQLAASNLNVLLLGETGAGKELFAQRIHERSGRRGPFLAVNCASIPAELVGAELFGHTKNAFSGAAQARKGMFVAAEHGTLLLDEVGDCPPAVQAALLRTLQEKSVRPIGAEREVAVDVRVIAATHADLESAVAHGSFRADLYARLSQGVVRIPPLRARRTEVLSLARELAGESSRTLRISADAAEALLLWSFPLNVRELQSLVRAYSVLHADEELDLAVLARLSTEIAARMLARKRGAAVEPSAGATLPPSAQSERAQLRALLEAHDGNVAKVAERVGKPRAQVYRWMKSMGLSAAKFRR